jgi:CII-binding regulator of phage lambda lysogenization HflD
MKKPSNTTTPFSIRFSPQLTRAIINEATKLGVTPSEIIRQLLATHFTLDANSPGEQPSLKELNKQLTKAKASVARLTAAIKQAASREVEFDEIKRTLLSKLGKEDFKRLSNIDPQRILDALSNIKN